MNPKKGAITKKKAMTKAELEEALINNFTNLQRVLTNLSLKFEDLSNNISKMLQLFEISAKSFAEKISEKDLTPEPRTQAQKEMDKEYLKKLDSLLDQNKTIAKGIMLMEERIRQRNMPHRNIPEQNESRFKGMFKSKPLPKI